MICDAAYSASSAAGMGCSLVIIGATAFANTLKKYPESFQLALEYYNNTMRPFIDAIQAGAINIINKLIPRTAEEVKLLGFFINNNFQIKIID